MFCHFFEIALLTLKGPLARRLSSAFFFRGPLPGKHLPAGKRTPAQGRPALRGLLMVFIVSSSSDQPGIFMLMLLKAASLLSANRPMCRPFTEWVMRLLSALTSST